VTRVVVTGVGLVTAVCTGDAAALPPALESGRSAIAPVTAFATDGLRARLAAEVPPAALAPLIDVVEARRWSRVSQLAVGAARLAARDARLEGESDVHLVVGTEFGDLRSTEEFAAGYLARGAAGLSPLAFPNTVMNTMASAVAIALGLRGASVTLNCRRVPGELAVAQAVALVTGGRARHVIAGGVDEISPFMFRVLGQSGGLSRDNGHDEGCRPYDRTANGAVRGEGAAFLVVESIDIARARGARVRGEIRGAAWHAGARAPTIGAALDAAGVRADEIAWVYSAASGDPRDDAAQLKALGRVPDLGHAALTSLAPLAGAHAGLGPLHVAAAMWTATAGRLPGIATLRTARTAAALGPGVHPVRPGPGLVHGVARRGDQVALVVAGA
jgi:3-oxoacyl-[acyl-carrier-protein] synthase II